MRFGIVDVRDAGGDRAPGRALPQSGQEEFIEKTAKLPAEVIIKAAKNQDMVLAEVLSAGKRKGKGKG